MSEIQKQLQNEQFKRVMNNATERGYYIRDSATELSVEEVNRRYAELRKLGSVQSRKNKRY